MAKIIITIEGDSKEPQVQAVLKALSGVTTNVTTSEIPVEAPIVVETPVAETPVVEAPKKAKKSKVETPVVEAVETSVVEAVETPVVEAVETVEATIVSDAELQEKFRDVIVSLVKTSDDSNINAKVRALLSKKYKVTKLSSLPVADQTAFLADVKALIEPIVRESN